MLHGAQRLVEGAHGVAEAALAEHLARHHAQQVRIQLGRALGAEFVFERLNGELDKLAAALEVHELVLRGGQVLAAPGVLDAALLHALVGALQPGKPQRVDRGDDAVLEVLALGARHVSYLAHADGDVVAHGALAPSAARRVVTGVVQELLLEGEAGQQAAPVEPAAHHGVDEVGELLGGRRPVFDVHRRVDARHSGVDRLPEVLLAAAKRFDLG